MADFEHGLICRSTFRRNHPGVYEKITLLKPSGFFELKYGTVLSRTVVSKSNVFEGEWSNFDQENFVLDCFDIDWPNILKLD